MAKNHSDYPGYRIKHASQASLTFKVTMDIEVANITTKTTAAVIVAAQVQEHTIIVAAQVEEHTVDSFIVVFAITDSYFLIQSAFHIMPGACSLVGLITFVPVSSSYLIYPQTSF